jgi:VCBS repeat-containing protein
MAGNDMLDGGAGTDTAVYSGLKANYTWVQNVDGSWLVTDLRAGGDGVDTLVNIEQLQFADATAWIGPAVPVANTAPVITTAPPSITLTEWADLSAAEAANTAHTAQGKIAFSDPDSLDVHAASVTPQGTGYLGSFTLGAVDESANNLGWSFNVSDSALDYLKAGQTLTQNYAVTIDDGHGGTASQTVSVVLAGADDATAVATTPTTTTTTGGGKSTRGGSKKGGGNAADGNDAAHHDNAPGPSDDKFSFNSDHGHTDAMPHLGGLLALIMTHASAHAHVEQAAAGLLHAEDVVQMQMLRPTTAAIG